MEMQQQMPSFYVTDGIKHFAGLSLFFMQSLIIWFGVAADYIKNDIQKDNGKC
jgi:hypothetical protein